MAAPGFWDDQQQAAKISSEHARLTRRRERYDSLTQESADLNELIALASDDGELDEVAESVADLKLELDRLQEEALFSGEYDPGDAVVSIHAGEGGTDAQDWGEMLLRMYLRWAEGRRFKTELLEASPGEEAGLKSATFTVSGENAYGVLKAERGVHRLVRLSPFDQAHRRHTSFAQVIVSPLLSDDSAIDIDEIRSANRHLPGERGGRAAREQDRLGGTHHAPPDRDRGQRPERALAALQQEHRDEDPSQPPCRGRAGAA